MKKYNVSLDVWMKRECLFYNNKFLKMYFFVISEFTDPLIYIKPEKKIMAKCKQES